MDSNIYPALALMQRDAAKLYGDIPEGSSELVIRVYLVECPSIQVFYALTPPTR